MNSIRPINRFVAPARRHRAGLLLLALLVMVVLAACGGADVTPTTSPTEAAPPAEAVATPAPIEAAAPAEAAPAATLIPAGEQPTAPGIESVEMPADPVSRDGMFDASPPMIIDPSLFYYATLKTQQGDIKVQLFADRAPTTVNNFVYLARAGFYDNTSFHRVLEGFMAQAGDPAGTGTGGPGYRFEDEFYPGLGFDRAGLLAMANAGPGTNGSQFFITFAPTEWLNDKHTIFGEVIEGMDVLNAITIRDPQANPDIPGDTLYTILIEEGDSSSLPSPTPAPPTATPTVTPTPYAPTSLESSGDEKPLAALPAEERAAYFNTPPEMVIDTDLTYTALISTTQGEMTMALYDDQAPQAVNNFVVLANLGFFDGIPINQSGPGETVVLGSVNNLPTGDAGYLVTVETSTEISPTKGVVAYYPFQIQPGIPTVSSSSIMLFALIDVPEQALGLYSFFGQITNGMDVLDALTMEDQVVSITILSE